MESFRFADSTQEARYDAYVEGGTMSPDDARRVLGIAVAPEQVPESDWIDDLVDTLPVDSEPQGDWAPTDVLKSLPKEPVLPDWGTVQYKD